MFAAVGKAIDRHGRIILAVWMLLLIAAMAVNHSWFDRLNIPGLNVPSWADVAEDGEFSFLPENMPSLAGERLLAAGFPDDLLKSSVVFVVRREVQPLSDGDREFIEKILKPRLEEVQADPVLGKNIASVRSFSDKEIGRLLQSADRRASLVIAAFTTEFLEAKNQPTIERFEKIVYSDIRELRPPGLDVAMSGSATVGRDMMVANKKGAQATEFWTTILVIVLLIAIYRAPLLAPIPLLTVFLAVEVSKAMLTFLTLLPQFNYRVFLGMEVYITVVVYGAGVDYCVFLISRYKEELDAGRDAGSAMQITLERVGAALVASAGTVICGIGMMVFAQFGKFREAGIGISLSLCVCLLAGLTFTPSLLRLAGRSAFWPFGLVERIRSGEGDHSGTSLVNRLIQRNRMQIMWEHVSFLLVRYPGRILLTCYLAMLPFAVVGYLYHDYLSYGLLSELPAETRSRIGAEAVQRHFPAGNAGPLTVLIRNQTMDFRNEDSPGGQLLSALAEGLKPRLDELGLADIRYLKKPLGILADDAAAGDDGKVSVLERVGRRAKAIQYYVSQVDAHRGMLTRLDLIFKDDPFSRYSISQLSAVEAEVQKLLKTVAGSIENSAQTEVLFVGPTASMRDLKTVTDHDQVKIDILVMLVVFVILVVLLRKVFLSGYLIMSVFFSYLVTLGVTCCVFWWIDPEFAGLDWKVPMFLFTILIAVGEDYNIFLMSRIEEEQARRGRVEGIRMAMLQTGSIISSCGIIMAGTFLSLLAGYLVGMKQLGFALAFGVLLDTFVVRTALVPCFLVMLESGRFGALGRWMGGAHGVDETSRTSTQGEPSLKPAAASPGIHDR